MVIGARLQPDISDRIGRYPAILNDPMLNGRNGGTRTHDNPAPNRVPLPLGDVPFYQQKSSTKMAGQTGLAPAYLSLTTRRFDSFIFSPVKWW